MRVYTQATSSYTNPLLMHTWVVPVVLAIVNNAARFFITFFWKKYHMIILNDLFVFNFNGLNAYRFSSASSFNSDMSYSSMSFPITASTCKIWIHVWGRCVCWVESRFDWEIKSSVHQWVSSHLGSSDNEDLPYTCWKWHL